MNDFEKDLLGYLKEEKRGNISIERYKKFKVNDFIANLNWQIKLKQMVIDYIKYNKFDSNSLMILGCSGSGKTHLSCAIGNYVSSINKEVKRYDFNEISKKITKLYFTGQEYTRYFMENFDYVDLIIIEDFFKEVSENTKRSAFILIDYLYVNNKKIVINSEKTIKQLTNIDIAIYGRLKEMCKENIFEIENKIENNYRMRDD